MTRSKDHLELPKSAFKIFTKVDTQKFNLIKKDFL